MAASIPGAVRIVGRLSRSLLHPLRQSPCRLLRLPVRTCPDLPLCAPPSRCFSRAARLQSEETDGADAPSRYKDRPWDYLESEEYIEKYGDNLVWSGYRRNHKGSIPPQKTRKTCIRGDKVCGNPCPICRDPNIIVHHQNVKLLEQFISPHTGMLYDPTQTGVCIKQQKKLLEAIGTAQNNGLLHFQIPYVDFTGEDYSNCHDAVGSTPHPQAFSDGDTWYKWYGEIIPDEHEVAKVKKTYKAYLK